MKFQPWSTDRLCLRALHVRVSMVIMLWEKTLNKIWSFIQKRNVITQIHFAAINYQGGSKIKRKKSTIQGRNGHKCSLMNSDEIMFN